jgi:hypothetical protein
MDVEFSGIGSDEIDSSIVAGYVNVTIGIGG